MTHQQIKKLNDIVNTLHSVKQNKVPTFIHSNITSLNGIGKIEYSYEVDRETHLESMIEWAIDQIQQNFDLEIEI